MSDVVAIDPGTKESGYCHLIGGGIAACGTLSNDILLDWLTNDHFGDVAVVFEKVTSYGKVIGASTLETVFWTGRMFQAAKRPEYFHRVVSRISRLDVKMHMCRSAKAGDKDIRKALIARYGAKGTKAHPGPLYPVSGHAWAALALAVTWLDRAACARLPRRRNLWKA